MAKRTGSGQSQDQGQNLKDNYIEQEARKELLKGLRSSGDMEALLQGLNPVTKARVGTSPVENLQDDITTVSDLDVLDRTTGNVIREEIRPDLFLKGGKKPRVMSPARAAAIARKVSTSNPLPNISAQDRVNIQQAGIDAEANDSSIPREYNQELGEPAKSFRDNTEQQNMYGGGLNTVIQDDQVTDPWVENNQQPIANMLEAVKKDRAEQWTDTNIGNIQTRVAQDRLGYSSNAAEELADIVWKMKPQMEKKFNPQMVLQPLEQAAMENSLRKLGYKDDSSLTHLMYHVVNPAVENMRGNFPGGLIGAMYLSTIQKVWESEVARDKKILDIDYYPDGKTQEERAKQFAALNDPQRAAIRGLEREAWNEQFNSEKNIGYLIGQAGGIKLTGEQTALMGMVALESVRDFAPNTVTSRKERADNSWVASTPLDTREQQVQDQLMVNDTLSLTAGIKDWVESNQALIKTLLKIPQDQLRVGEAGRLPLKKFIPDIRTNFIELSVDSYYKGKNFTDRDQEIAYAVAEFVFSDTPSTIMGTQLQLATLLFGMDNVSEEFKPNTITPLFDQDMKGFLNIEKTELSNGEQSTVGNREKTMFKIHPDGTEEEIFWGADTEKDNKFINNIIWAHRMLGKQFRSDYFSGSNGRFYQKAFALHTDDQFARSMYGSGINFNYYLSGKTRESRQDLMDIKGSIIKNSGLLLPNSQVKYESGDMSYAEEAFDEIIPVWQEKYSTLVQIADAFMPLGDRVSKKKGKQALTFEQKTLIRESLNNPESELALAATSLINYAKGLNGIFTINSVVEAIKLKNALDEGKEVYSTNFIHWVDGVNNGPATNAVKVGYERLMEGTGVTPYVVNASIKGREPFQNEHNLLAGKGPAYHQTAEATFSIMSRSHNPVHKKLAKILYEYGAISVAKMKKSVMPAAYGVGKPKVKKLAKEIVDDMIVQDPYVLKLLSNLQITPEDAALRLGNKTWTGITEVIGPLQAYTALHRDFMLNILEQYANAKINGNPLKTPFYVSSTGRLIPFGLAQSTAHGDTFSYDNIGTFTQVTNVLNPLGKEFDKDIGGRKEHYKALSAMNPVMTHLEDTDGMVHMAIDMLNENPAEAYGLKGGFAIQKYDGLGIPPKMNEWTDKRANENFIIIAFKKSNFQKLVETHSLMGYDMNYKGSSKVKNMQDIIGSAQTEEAKGRAFLNDKTLQINQFPINGGVVLKRTGAERKLSTTMKREDYISKLAVVLSGQNKIKSAMTMLDDVGKKTSFPKFEISQYKVREKALPKIPKVNAKVWNTGNFESKEEEVKASEAKRNINKKEARHEIKDIKYSAYEVVHHADHGIGKIAWILDTTPEAIKAGAHPVSYAVVFDGSWKSDANFYDPGKGTFPVENAQPGDNQVHLYSQDDLFSSPELARKNSGSTGLFD